MSPRSNSSKTCPTITEHVIQWGGDGYFCVYCGLEFKPVGTGTQPTTQPRADNPPISSKSAETEQIKEAKDLNAQIDDFLGIQPTCTCSQKTYHQDDCALTAALSPPDLTNYDVRELPPTSLGLELKEAKPPRCQYCADPVHDDYCFYCGCLAAEGEATALSDHQDVILEEMDKADPDWAKRTNQVDPRGDSVSAEASTSVHGRQQPLTQDKSFLSDREFREQKIYEIGHQEGESCERASWVFALDEAFDIDFETLPEAVDKVEQLISQRVVDAHAALLKYAAHGDFKGRCPDCDASWPESDSYCPVRLSELRR